ncbi:hypothetical protein ACFXKW_23590 [Streptomyces sp. NPDC059193]|uniref:hypothetical protein n=1 Tax=Streptomyces sp. NPDC059193 TaxID=3346763 RepID=UPI0036B047A9
MKTDKELADWWEALPAAVSDQVDERVLANNRFAAIQALWWEHGRTHGLGLHEAQLIVHNRYLHHGDRVARIPDARLDVESLAAGAARAAGRVVAIEVVWDGDTEHDWFTSLRAITADPAGERHLASVYWGVAERYLGDESAAPGLTPPAAAADKAGRALAAHLGVPFHFASPGTPDEEAPRWRP